MSGCQQCGAPVSRPDGRFCSYRCWVAFTRSIPPAVAPESNVKPCVICGADMVARTRRTVVCSPDCLREYGRRKALAAYHALTDAERRVVNQCRIERKRVQRNVDRGRIADVAGDGGVACINDRIKQYVAEA